MFFMEIHKNTRAYLDRIFTLGFFCHDELVRMLSRYYSLVKRLLLVVASSVLVSFFLPIFTSLRGDFGEIAGNILIFILFLSPISVIFRTRLLFLLMGLRRELGILMGYLALVHGMGYFITPHFFWVTHGSFWTGMSVSWEKGIVTGLIGLLLILPPLLTSNNFSVRVLGGKQWKQWHRLVYPAFFFIVFHRFFMSTSDWFGVPFFESILLLIGYVIVKFLAWRPAAFPWLRENIVWMNLRYQQYQNTKS